MELLINRLREWDERITSRIMSVSLGPLGDSLILPAAKLFNFKGMLITLPAVRLLTDERTLVYVALSLGFGQAFNRVAKIMCERKRPTPPSPLPARTDFGALRVKVPKQMSGHSPDGASFPSGDAMAGSCVGTALWCCGYGRACLLIGPYAALGRVYFFCHYVLDVAAGVSVGAISATIVPFWARIITWVFGETPAQLALKHLAAVVPLFVVAMLILQRVAKWRSGQD